MSTYELIPRVLGGIIVGCWVLGLVCCIYEEYRNSKW